MMGKNLSPRWGEVPPVRSHAMWLMSDIEAAAFVALVALMVAMAMG